LREFILEKWPEVLVAIGFGMVWTAIIAPGF